MNKREMKKKQKEYNRQVRVIERKLTENISIGEAKLLLYVLVYQFDGFARQQRLINVYMASRYHWGNKRTVKVLQELAAIGVIDRWKSESDNWTLFFLVKGFIEKCKERIIKAGLIIKKRMCHYRLAIISIKDLEKGKT
ncbi:MAG: hypothetical protein QGH39_04085 [Candidatus Thermoplasmatota archaeon]|nr:hypothetical protein [Candidatus Thermoplasmatota archaeon]MDP7264721.1 hypothetical protein [Candidatus Thermoplasmatota archaeon]